MINHNIKSLPTAKVMNGNNLSIVIEAEPLLKAWLVSPDTKTGWLGCKRRSVASALKEFKSLYDVTEFFMKYQEQTEFWSDDSLEIHYRQKKT